MIAGTFMIVIGCYREGSHADIYTFSAPTAPLEPAPDGGVRRPLHSLMLVRCPRHGFAAYHEIAGLTPGTASSLGTICR